MKREEFPDRILAYLADKNYQPRKARALARVMGIEEAEYGDFRHAVKALTQSGRVVIGGGNSLILPETTGEFVGRFRANPRGFGFIIPESPGAHGDLFVPPGNTLNAVTGDLVSARVLKKGKRDGRMLYEGRITRIIERGRSQFVGALSLEAGKWFVTPEGNLLHAPIFIADPRAKGAKAGDQVVVEITSFPTDTSHAQGVITKVLGPAGEPETDTLSMIHQHQLPTEFPQSALDYARAAVAKYDPAAAAVGREDLRELVVITIDPDDARDFDDAISITSSRKGTVELGVHIADVSHFVTKDSPLDLEARERATSVYFPRYVIPMLPEVLSNGVCSLQEAEPRLTKSAFITYNRKGEVVSERVANTIIASAKRLTYTQASAAINGQPGSLSKPVVDLLHEMETLARAIQSRRRRHGMLELDLPEVEIVFDDTGRVTGVKPADNSYSHKIIEMFMVEANECVARLLADLNIPNLRRIHPNPDEAAGTDLTKFLRALGLKAPSLLDRAAVQSLLREVAGTPHEFAVNLAVLRSMQRAVYSPQLLGHYALASEHYSHFTSPIRRYPDLTTHRLVDRIITGKTRIDRDKSAVPSYEALEELGAHCSKNERRAEDAERELRLVKILRLLESRVGNEVTGIVTGVTNFGMFVQLGEFLIDGLLRFDDLGDDWWEVDTSRGCVMGQRTGRRYSIGQSLRVTIAAIDVPTRRIDLAIGPATPGDAARSKRRTVEKPGAPGAARKPKTPRRGAARPPKVGAAKPRRPARSTRSRRK